MTSSIKIQSYNHKSYISFKSVSKQQNAIKSVIKVPVFFLLNIYISLWQSVCTVTLIVTTWTFPDERCTSTTNILIMLTET